MAIVVLTLTVFSDRPVADPSVFVATLRIVLLTLELQPRSRL